MHGLRNSINAHARGRQNCSLQQEGRLKPEIELSKTQMETHVARPNKEQMKLSCFMMADANYSRTGWRNSEAYSDAGFNFSRWIELAGILERGKFDMLFIADQISAPGLDDRDTFCKTASTIAFEPLMLLAALSQSTTKLGLAATIATTWSEPYSTARMLASLDRISNGRSGWNVVTGRNSDDALNFSKDSHVAHADRYERAEEFVDICKGLWDSYDDNAVIADKLSGQFVNPQALHVLNHKGKHFSVRGPLSVARPIQGHPVIIQAGASEPALEMAARVADCMFTAQADLESAKTFYRNVKSRLAAYGRERTDLKILPGVSIYVAKTRKEANEKFDYTQSLTSVEYAVRQMGAIFGADFSKEPLDGPIPQLKPNLSFINPEKAAKAARADNLTLRQFAMRVAAAKSHQILVGSPSEVADQLEIWFDEEAADGFNILPPVVPGPLNDIVDLLIPELQSRGLVRTEYTGNTLREHLGVERPADAATQRKADGVV